MYMCVYIGKCVYVYIIPHPSNNLYPHPPTQRPRPIEGGPQGVRAFLLENEKDGGGGGSVRRLATGVYVYVCLYLGAQPVAAS